MSGAIGLSSSGRLTVTSVDVALTAQYAEDAAHSSGDSGVFILTKRTDAAASSAGTDGDYATLNTTAAGKLWIAGAYAEDAAHADGDLGVAMLTRRIDAAASSAGTSADYATLNTDATGKLWVSGAFAEDAAHTSGDIGLAVLARYKAAPAVSAGTDLDYATIDVGTEGGVYTQPVASAVGGASVTSILGANTDNATAVKASAGTLYSIQAVNINAATRYLKFYNKATAPSSADTPVLRIALPPSVPVNITFGAAGLAFATGIGLRVVTGIADNDNTAVAASEQLVNVAYK